MIDMKKMVLYAITAIVGLSLYSAWLEDYSSDNSAPQAAEIAVVSGAEISSPSVAAALATAGNAPTANQVHDTAEQSGQIVTITTDVMQAKIDTLGGRIIETRLLNYPQKIVLEKPVRVANIHLFNWSQPGYSTEPIVLLSNQSDKKYLAQTDISDTQTVNTSTPLRLFQIDKNHYELTHHEDLLEIPLVWRNDQGIQLTKTYVFHRNSYAITVNYRVDNHSTDSYRGYIYGTIDRKELPAPSTGFLGMATYSGAAISTTDHRYTKVSYGDMRTSALNTRTEGGWIAMIEHYFISAWVPPTQGQNYLYTVDHKNGIFTVGIAGSEFNVPAGASYDTQWTFYTGPAEVDQLSAVAPNLTLTVDYGWLWIVCEPIFWVLEKFHDLFGNWGWAIVAVTVLIKLIFFPLSAMSYRSMAAMRALQPKIESLKERFKNDKQKLGQATMELYRKEKANPLSGCFPVIIQIPVFIALYYVLMESVELRQAPFIAWINDLSSRDPWFILPILMGISMVVQQRLNPTPVDPAQAKIMLLLPIFFTGIFLFFPSGLVLYWVINNVLSVLQQVYITKKYQRAVANKRNS